MKSNADRLASCIKQNNWDELMEILKPKFFPKDEHRKLVSPQIMAIIAETLTNANKDVPVKIKIIILKCLMNSCVDGYLHKEYNGEVDSSLNYSNALYSKISNIGFNSSDKEPNQRTSYPFFTHFPYTGVAAWAADYIINYIADHEYCSDELEILRLCIQFLCNLSTFACKSKIYPEYENIPRSMEQDAFKNAIMNLIQHEHILIAKAACAYIQNTWTHSSGNYYTDNVKKQLILLLPKLLRLECKAATDVLIQLMKEPNRLRLVYEDMHIEDKLCLLELLYSELRNSVYYENRKDDFIDLPVDAIEFLSKKFQRKSDLILKTVDTYLDGIEPTEVTILLDILGALTATSSSGHCTLQNDKSLLINCIFLLKSLQMLGKDLNNYFTPVQKLSELAPSTRGIKETNMSGECINSQDKDVQVHPAFGFKAGLIRVIGNMIHKHKENQDLLRESDGIPLLLDCCNIDARNPLIIQWVILALRNACENNKENQNIIRNSTKIDVVDSAVLQEMGLTLNKVLLKSLVRKELNNDSSLVHKFSELASGSQCIKETNTSEKDACSKEVLIRIIGNMIQNNKENQDLLRKIDGIPLLLDCCNVDARNSLIVQRVILALQNAHENNIQNEKVIQNLIDMCLVDSNIVEEIEWTPYEENI